MLITVRVPAIALNSVVAHGLGRGPTLDCKKQGSALNLSGPESAASLLTHLRIMLLGRDAYCAYRIEVNLNRPSDFVLPMVIKVS